MREPLTGRSNFSAPPRPETIESLLHEMRDTLRAMEFMLIGPDGRNGMRGDLTDLKKRMTHMEHQISHLEWEQRQQSASLHKLEDSSETGRDRMTEILVKITLTVGGAFLAIAVTNLREFIELVKP